MEVKAWNNGKQNKSGAGYGLKLSIKDRNKYFKRLWKSVFIKLPNEAREIECNIDKDSFWNETCGEFINKKIGQWFLKNNYAPWSKGQL
jgi:hypothetical protein